MSSDILTIISKYLNVTGLGEFSSFEDQVRMLPKERVLQLMFELGEQLPAPRKNVLGFDFLGNSAASGLGSECIAPSCRVKKIESAVAFAALYAEQLILFNPFQNATLYFNIDDVELSKREVREAAFAVSTVIMLLPLIERGIVTFMPFDPIHICQECLSDLMVNSLEIDNINPDANVYGSIYKSFLDNCDVHIDERWESGGISFKMTGSEQYLEHGELYHVFDVEPDFLKGVQEQKILSSDIVHKLGIFRHKATIKTYDLTSKAVASSQYKTKNVLSDSTELQILNILFPEDIRKNKIDAEVPILSARNVNDLIKLRDKEWHHFEQYRSKVFDYVEDVDTDGKELEDVYREKIAPDLIEIEHVLDKSRRKAGKSIIDNSGIAAFSISAACLTSGLSTLVPAAISILGGGHFVKSMVPAIRERFETPAELLEKDLYFTWKVKKKFD